MYFDFNGYRHDVGEVDVRRSRETIRSTATQRVLGVKLSWSLSGTLLADSSSEIAIKVQKLLDAYSTPALYCGFRDPSNAKVPSFWINASDTLYGIRVVNGPNYPSMNATQHVTHYDYQINLEAQIPDPNAQDIRDWSESLSFSGGGERFVHLEPLYGLPVKVLAHQNTVFRVQQSGRAVGWLYRPPPAAPIWPEALMQAPVIRLQSPRSEEGTLVDWGIDWTYEYESATKLFGVPTAIT